MLKSQTHSQQTLKSQINICKIHKQDQQTHRHAIRYAENKKKERKKRKKRKKRK
jgi:hypothetical protein